ncbi:hypothetical protein Scep_012291 [Stephania cephalantha]|uniref:Uncharacterized protein n=1 Tax=Stephania cephalantha TaxID=152367 RepID=A0AAP0JEW2_9MAGN
MKKLVIQYIRYQKVAWYQKIALKFKLRERLANFPKEERTQKHMDIIFDDVVGKDKCGRVQTFGLSLSKKDVLKKSAQVPSPEIVRKIRGEIWEEMKGQFENYMQANMPTLVQSYLEKIGVSIPSSCIQVPDTSSTH